MDKEKVKVIIDCHVEYETVIDDRLIVSEREHNLRNLLPQIIRGHSLMSKIDNLNIASTAKIIKLEIERRSTMLPGLIAWLLGVPLVVIVLAYLLL